MKGEHNGYPKYLAAASAAEGAIMSYPKNKRERLLIGNCKGRKRVSLWFLDNDPRNVEWKKDNIRRHRDTTKKCSALWCCGNPRRMGELTLQELKFLRSLKD